MGDFFYVFVPHERNVWAFFWSSARVNSKCYSEKLSIITFLSVASPKSNMWIRYFFELRRKKLKTSSLSSVFLGPNISSLALSRARILKWYWTIFYANSNIEKKFLQYPHGMYLIFKSQHYLFLFSLSLSHIWRSSADDNVF